MAKMKAKLFSDNYNMIMLHWEVSPSGTWARHSLATNLIHAGVERSYIDEGMGSCH